MYQFPLIAGYLSMKAWVDTSWSMTIACMRATGILTSSKDVRP